MIFTTSYLDGRTCEPCSLSTCSIVAQHSTFTRSLTIPKR